jgi:hypothetical protein
VNLPIEWITNPTNSEDNASVWLRVLCKQTFYHLADEPLEI